MISLISSSLFWFLVEIPEDIPGHLCQSRLSDLNPSNTQSEAVITVSAPEIRYQANQRILTCFTQTMNAAEEKIPLTKVVGEHIEKVTETSTAVEVTTTFL